VAHGVRDNGDTRVTGTAGLEIVGLNVAGRVVGCSSPTGQTVVYRIFVDVTTISEVRDAGQ